jgi:hypothetical protein
MNAKQRRKHRRAYPDRYWTQEEIDLARKRAEELRQLLHVEHVAALIVRGNLYV